LPLAWKEKQMSFDFVVGGVTFVGLLGYLLFALVRCERF
jgi:K+-transporting ATPase KdpF subunit